MQKFVGSIFAILNQLPHTKRYVIAFSGGIDSSVLLHALASHRQQLPELKAIHVNHGLNDQALMWAEHCRTVCAQLAIEFQLLTVDARTVKGDSPEETARRMRYKALAACVHKEECLLTAHHQDDQAETVLLQLLRGSGPRGLAAMPQYTQFSYGYLARPLLNATREQVHHYAENFKLKWIDDSSNQNAVFDRNYLRLYVMPLLRERWPSFSKTLTRSAQLCADAAVILHESAAQDLLLVQEKCPDAINIRSLKQLSLTRQSNVLHYWFLHLHLPSPAKSHINQILQQALSESDAQMLITWDGVEVRRYQGILYAMRKMHCHEVEPYAWQINHELDIPGVGNVYARLTQGQGLDPELIKQQPIIIRFRQGGESCRLPGRRHTHLIKKLFQEWKVKPWMRNRIPLVFVGDRLAAIAGFVVCEGFQVDADKQGWKVDCEYEYPPV